MAIDPSTVARHRSFDERGRALPMTEAEIRERAEAAKQALRALDDMGDAEEQRQTLDALIQAIDYGPPEYRMSYRKKFD